MKKTLLVLTTFITSMTFAQDCSDLFISEYVEGWSNNKAIEIYNPTSSPIDLSEYMLIRYSNGGTTTTTQNGIQLTGTIGAYDAYVAVIDKTDPNGTGQDAPVWDDLQSAADGFYCPDYNASFAMYFNGDDAMVLAKGIVSNIAGSAVVDVFGKIGEDPGTAWTDTAPYNDGTGIELTKDHSLIRKSTILVGVTDPNVTEFNALMEYDSIPPVYEVITATDTTLYGNWASLGVHDCDCNTGSVSEMNESNVSIYPNPSTGSFSVKGIENFETVSVINSLGQNVQTIKNNTKSVVKFTMNNRRGVYFVKLTGTNGSVVTKRVIIK